MTRTQTHHTHHAHTAHHAHSGSSTARPRPRGFDITAAVRGVCHHAISNMPELAHIDLARVGFSVSQTRNRSKYGIYASLTPLRFHGGAEVTRRRGRDVRVQRVIDSNGREMLYIYTLYLPRFMDQSFSEKLVTIFHELWHISPQCNGDIRRHHGRCYAHTGSQANYDRHMKSLTDQWLSAHQPSDEIIGFLKQNFVELHAAHGGVYGSRYARPKLIPVALLPPAPSANTP